MSYRLLIVADVYPVDASIRQFIGHYPHWRSLSYSQLSERFALQHYGFTNLSLDVIQALGVDVRSVVGRFAPLQATWAREHGLPFVTEGDALDVIVAQVVAFQPDVLYVVDPWFWPLASGSGCARRATRRPCCCCGKGRGPTMPASEMSIWS